MKPVRYTHRKLKSGKIKVYQTNTKKSVTAKLVDKALKKMGK